MNGYPNFFGDDLKGKVDYNLIEDKWGCDLPGRNLRVQWGTLRIKHGLVNSWAMFDQDRSWHYQIHLLEKIDDQYYRPLYGTTDLDIMKWLVKWHLDHKKKTMKETMKYKFKKEPF